jgi:hypothetical protein
MALDLSQFTPAATVSSVLRDDFPGGKDFDSRLIAPALMVRREADSAHTGGKETESQQADGEIINSHLVGCQQVCGAQSSTVDRGDCSDSRSESALDTSALAEYAKATRTPVITDAFMLQDAHYLPVMHSLDAKSLKAAAKERQRVFACSASSAAASSAAVSLIGTLTIF